MSRSDVLNKLEDVKLINMQESDRTYKEHWVKVRGGFGLSQIGDNCRGDSGILCRNPRTRTGQNYESLGIL